MTAAADILNWSTSKLALWRQDALRRLAGSGELTQQDEEELLALVRQAAGFAASAPPPAAVALDATHLQSPTGASTLAIKAIQNVANVNRLAPGAKLTFEPNGLTIVYGRNGSGKSGFVRILRTACRTRFDNPTKLKVLADVYGPPSGPQSAEIVIDCGSGDEVVCWAPGAAASERLLKAAVFDSSAATLYVDGGNHIHFLPFSLALPHKLNELCLRLKARLDDGRTAVTQKIGVARPSFALPRETASQTFCKTLKGETTDAGIDKACAFTPADGDRLGDLVGLLAAQAGAQADLEALIIFLRVLKTESADLSVALSDDALKAASALRAAADGARKAAGLGASELFSNEPLEGVGEEAWRALWAAARDFSTVAYPKKPYPVVSAPDDDAVCVLCQQPLGSEGSQRLLAFQDYMSGALSKAADEAEAKVVEALKRAPELGRLGVPDWAARLDQVAKRDADLAASITSFRAAIVARRQAFADTLEGQEAASVENLAEAPLEALGKLADALEAEQKNLANAADLGKRAELQKELAELEDRKLLSGERDRLVVLRDLLKEDSLYATALSETNTKGITQKASELLDKHLTKAVSEQFDQERKRLDILHLKVGLSRKSDQVKASFEMKPGTTLTKLASDILSEGEQRALALATFFTEIAMTEGGGPIIIDDPVSSLDRERGARVAKCIAEEAKVRQVIVFTHDLVFFNELSGSADKAGTTTSSVALFSDSANAGKIDPGGVSWMGASVKKRLGLIKDEFSRTRKLHETSPSEYEYNIKNLYGRLRDAYERTVEEHIFCGVISRGVDRIETQKLRHVHLPHELAIRFHEGMTKANTYSHDNSRGAAIQIPSPAEFDADFAFLETLIKNLKTASDDAEANRPSMKAK